MSRPSPADPQRCEADLRFRLIGLAERFAGRRVAVIGDVIADEFLYGRPARISREAPVLILDHDRTAVVPGGAGNAAGNAGALGGDVRLVGFVGPGDRELLDGLQAQVDTSRVLRPHGYRAPVKTRILAGGPHTARQQIVRVDRGPAGEVGVAAAAFERAALDAVDGCDAVLVSDYGSGLLTPALFARLRERLAAAGGRSAVPLLVDSRHRLADFPGCTACTPNQSEAEQVLGRPIDDDPASLESAGRELLRRTAAGAGVVVTRGSRGMAVFVPGRPTDHVPIFGSDEVADVTGAGDTVIATLALALAAGASLHEGARLANYAAGLVVMKRGTATVTGSELVQAMRTDCDRGKEP